MTRKEKAFHLFQNDFNCAQSVFSAFAPDLGLDEGLAKKIACGFGAGMGCTARTCGAVTGAFMVIGLKFGKQTIEDRESKPLTYQKVNRFIELFEARHASIACLDLMPIDIRTPAGMAEAREKNVFKDVCFPIVADAIKILEEEIL